MMLFRSLDSGERWSSHSIFAQKNKNIPLRSFCAHKYFHFIMLPKAILLACNEVLAHSDFAEGLFRRRMLKGTPNLLDRCLEASPVRPIGESPDVWGAATGGFYETQELNHDGFNVSIIGRQLDAKQKATQIMITPFAGQTGTHSEMARHSRFGGSDAPPSFIPPKLTTNTAIDSAR